MTATCFKHRLGQTNKRACMLRFCGYPCVPQGLLLLACSLRMPQSAATHTPLVDSFLCEITYTGQSNSENPFHSFSRQTAADSSTSSVSDFFATPLLTTPTLSTCACSIWARFSWLRISHLFIWINLNLVSLYLAVGSPFVTMVVNERTLKWPRSVRATAPPYTQHLKHTNAHASRRAEQGRANEQRAPASVAVAAFILFHTPPCRDHCSCRDQPPNVPAPQCGGAHQIVLEG